MLDEPTASLDVSNVWKAEEVIAEYRRSTGAAAGIVSLPVDAVKYQIMIMFMVSAGTGFGTLAAVWMTSRRLFDDRDRLRLDRLEI